MKKPAAQPPKTEGETLSAPETGDLLTVLEDEHRQLRALMDGTYDLEDLLKHWLPHQAVEQDVLIPALAEQDADEDEAFLVRRDLAAILLAALRQEQVSASAPVRAVLGELLTALMAAEEAPETGLFARVRSAAIDLRGLQQQADTARRGAMERLDAGDDRDLAPRRLGAAQAEGESSQTRENDVMQRQYERERDAEGRFVSERGRGASSRSSRYDDDDHRSGRRRDDDNQRGHGGWFGDPQGHAQAARRGWDERDDRRSSSRYDDDDRRYQSRSRYEDDDRRSGRRDDDDDRRGHGGWFGDSQGHAEAARRGGEERDDRHSGGRYDDDDRRYQSRSRYQDDDRRSGRRGDDDDRHGHGGWFGDPEGHAQAARRGWEERDDRRSGGRYDDDRYASRRRDDDDDHDGRRRGWSGDPQGHSEAARRGWEHRRG